MPNLDKKIKNLLDEYYEPILEMMLDTFDEQMDDLE